MDQATPARKTKYSYQSPIDANLGYARHFERRPEQLFGIAVPEVVDASVLRRVPSGDLLVFRLSDLFSAPSCFLGFGIPNAYLTIPNGEGGTEKFAAFSLHRKPAEVQETREFVQAGILLYFKNVPDEAIDALRAAMRKHVGETFITCVHAQMTVMEEAGFTSGDQPLSTNKLPDGTLLCLLNNGLYWKGQKIEIEVIRTAASGTAEKHALLIAKAEAFTFCRHGQRNLNAKAQAGNWRAKATLKLIAAVNYLVYGFFWLLSSPARLLGLMKNKKEEKAAGKAVVAPGLPRDGQYVDVDVSVSMPSRLGMLMRWIWGSHALFQVSSNRVNVVEFLPGKLQAFPQKNPSLVTRLKKNILFNRLVIRIIRFFLCPAWVAVGRRNERDLFDMLRTHSEGSPNKYNLTLTSSPDANSPGGRKWNLTVARISVGLKLVDWILSKHVLITNWADWTHFAGEVWKGEDGVIYVSGNSGTYKPTDELADAMVCFLQMLFPHLTVRKATFVIA